MAAVALTVDRLPSVEQQTTGTQRKTLACFDKGADSSMLFCLGTGNKETLDHFLSRIPQSVIRGGKIVDVRGGLTNTLKVKLGRIKGVGGSVEPPLVSSSRLHCPKHATLKTLKMGSLRHSRFQTFSTGVCPRTPLVSCAFGTPRFELPVTRFWTRPSRVSPQ